MSTVTPSRSSRIAQEILGPDASERLLERYGAEDLHLSDLPWHLVVHLPDEPQGVILHLAGDADREQDLRQFPLFSSLIEAQLPLSFEDALFLTTVFPILPSAADPAYHAKRPSRQLQPALTDLLKGSRGILLYAHQLEQLLCMTAGLSPKAARSFRRDWNLKHPRSRSLAAQISIAHSYTVSDLLAECTLHRDGFVYSANFRGAYRLHNHLNR